MFINHILKKLISGSGTHIKLQVQSPRILPFCDSLKEFLVVLVVFLQTPDLSLVQIEKLLSEIIYKIKISNALSLRFQPVLKSTGFKQTFYHHDMLEKLPAVHCWWSICSTKEGFLLWWTQWHFSCSGFSATLDAGALSAAEIWSNINVSWWISQDVLIYIGIDHMRELSYGFNIPFFWVDHMLRQVFPLILRNLKSLPQLLDLCADIWTQELVLRLARL